eukprot:TRINITY_DN20727_c0_g1_i1.p1 TRINITY_DN20727_c0_g1~~TRINITY_DN20727_c0_g1_i1.p1  ORF type:complete len:237 (+),score=47.08 TRINITY_DN20727_c0_g1_i1:201-911(+)
MPAGNIAAVNGARRGRVLGQQIRSAWKFKAAARASEVVRQENQLAESLVKAYDEDFNGKLDREELPPMLRDYANRLYTDPQLPSERDIEFLVFLCDRPARDGTPGDGYIDRAEVLDVCYIWADFIEQKTTVQALMEKYAQCFQDALTEEELHDLLMEVDGQAVPAQVVKWIFRSADVLDNGTLSGIELARAVCALKMWREDRVDGAVFKRASLTKDLNVPDDLPRHQRQSCTCTVS